MKAGDYEMGWKKDFFFPIIWRLPWPQKRNQGKVFRSTGIGNQNLLHNSAVGSHLGTWAPRLYREMITSYFRP